MKHIPKNDKCLVVKLITIHSNIPNKEVCTTTTPSTLLYAYSNDLDVTFVQQSLDNIIRFNKQLSYRYKTFANVRLDSREGRGISYSSIDSFNSSVSAQLPDPSVAINDTNIGSDILKYLQDFAENQHVPTCGALVFVLAKRYPIDQDVSYLVSLLQKKHIFVYIIAQNIPSGGNSPHVLYNLSARTNGYCIFAGGSEFGYTANQAMGAIYRQYQFLSQSFVVSGAGRKTIPLIRSPKTVGYEQIMVAITIQNQRKDNHYKSLNYTISAVQGDYQFTGPTSQWPLWGTGILAAPQMNASMDYTMTIDYKYSEDQPQNVEVRMQSSYFFPDWLPFSN